MDKEQLMLLVAAAQKRDPDAFALLYSHYNNRLYKTAYYLIGIAEDAEDTVMETLADAYESIGKLRSAEAFEGWIFKILYNKARRRRGAVYYNATSELPETMQSDDVGEIEITDNLDLQRALATLSQEERSIVVFGVCDGYSSQEIGNIMSLNPNTVRSKQMRALAKLRGIMERE
ncbi:MAG: RNA polymerase sigma factor [Oscillospiraceae bacterium]